MNTMRWYPAAVVALLAAGALAGCGPGDPGDTAGSHPGTIRTVGNLDGTLADALASIFVKRVAYDGAAADAPIFLEAAGIQSLDPPTRRGIAQTYRNGHPVAVVHGNAAQNNELLAILGLQPNYTLPEGLSHSELFAVDREDGHAFVWSMYPPRGHVAQPPRAGAATYRDNAAHQLARTRIFHRWIDENGQRVSDAMKASRLAAARASPGAAEADNELTQLAQGFVTTRHFSDRGNNYQLSHFVYAVHSFSAADATDYDWFYVRQEGLFNAAAAYQGKSQIADPLGIVRQEEVSLYAGEYRMNNWMDGYTSADGGVVLLKPTPQNANGVTQVTSGIEWSIGGSVGFDGAKLTGGLEGGVKIQHSTSVTVNDCEIDNQSGSAVNDARWTYTFKRPTQTVYIGATLLATEPPVLSRSNFQPVNQWVWQFAPAVRNRGANAFKSKLQVPLYHTVTGAMRFLWTAWEPTHTVVGDEAATTWTFDVPLAYPPLLVVPHNMDFGAAGQYKSVDIRVARDWTAACDRAWCRVEPSSGTAANPRVNVTVDANASGAGRTATVTFRTADGRGTDSMTVFQAQY